LKPKWGPQLLRPASTNKKIGFLQPQKRYRNPEKQKNSFWARGFSDIKYHLEGETQRPKGG